MPNCKKGRIKIQLENCNEIVLTMKHLCVIYPQSCLLLVTAATAGSKLSPST